MKKKRRKLKVKNLLKLLSIPAAIIVLLFVFSGESEKPAGEVSPISSSKYQSFLENRSIADFILSPSETKGLDLKKLADEDYISYKNTETLEIELYSYAYLLIDMENRDALYAFNNKEKIYPASLTKLMTLDVILSHYYTDLDRTSSFTKEQQVELIGENASLAYLEPEREYTIRDLLYGLMLPSGADAAAALENLCEEDGVHLVEEMNKRAEELALTGTSFINTTGLHDDMHYTTLDDMFKVVWDILKYTEGQNILSSVEYTTEDGKTLKSTLYSLKDIEEVEIKGGKTGFTGQAGENIFVYYQKDGNSYALFLSGAPGNPYQGETYHFDDVRNIIKKLYSNAEE